MSDDVNLEELAELTESFTGADLAGLVRQASLQALRDSLQVEVTNEADVDLSVHKNHFTLALRHMRPSVSIEVIFLLFISQQSIFFYLYFFFFQIKIICRTKFSMNCYD